MTARKIETPKKSEAPEVVPIPQESKATQTPLKEIVEEEEKTEEKLVVAEGDQEKNSEHTTQVIHSKASELASNITGILATTLVSVVDLCDLQYVRLEQILSKEWNKKFMSLYG